MKRFIIIMSVFCCLCAGILLIPISIYEYKAHRNEFIGPYFSINNVYHSDNSNAQIVIMGNSRADEHYDTDLISDSLGMTCFNIGCHGYPIEFQYHIMFNAYMNRNTAPEYIILDVSPYCMFEYLTPRHSFEFLPYMSRKEFSYYIDTCKVFKPCDRFLLPKYAGLVYKVFKGIKSLNKMPAPKSEEYQTDFILTQSMELERDSDNIHALHAWIDDCVSRGIKPVLICSPMHHDHYRKFIDMEGFWSIVNNAVNGRDIPVLSYENLYGSDTRYFHDLLHLNKYGRHHFSMKLAHDLDSLGIIPSQKKKTT